MDMQSSAQRQRAEILRRTVPAVRFQKTKSGKNDANQRKKLNFLPNAQTD
jgi:hypothetical protein